jgi:hypothetical protein
MHRVAFLFLLVTVLSACASKPPCSDVNREDITPSQRRALEPEITRQLGAPKRVQVLQSFRFEDWGIIYVNTYMSDEAFLFYKHNPLASHYVTLWSGAARHDEESDILSWTMENAPGIPPQLASCFAYHVTKDRDL